jgi:cytochrome P450
MSEDLVSSTRPTVSFDHYGPDMGERAPEVVNELRDRCPVAWSEAHDGFWVVTKYDDIKVADSQFERFSASHGAIPDVFEGSKLPPINLDPPEHGVYRSLLQRWFTLRRVNSYRDKISEYAQAYVDRLGDRVDLVPEFFAPFPCDVMLHIIGSGDTDIRMVADLLHTMMYNFVDNPEVASRAHEQMNEYFIDELVADRRRNPADDLITHLATSKIDGEFIPDDMLALLLLEVLGGGTDTTTKVLATSLAYFVDNPAAMQAFRESDLATGVEELLRLFAPISIGRLARMDTELGGQQIYEGDRLLIMMMGANRDPEKFPNPNTADFARSPNPHLAFGSGIHRCLGMHLARIELVIVFEELFRAFADIRLQQGQRPIYTANQVWGATSVPVELTRR